MWVSDRVWDAFQRELEEAHSREREAREDYRRLVNSTFIASGAPAPHLAPLLAQGGMDPIDVRTPNWEETAAKLEQLDRQALFDRSTSPKSESEPEVA